MSGGTGRALGRFGLTVGLGIIGNIVAPGIGGAIGSAAGGILAGQLFPPDGGPDQSFTGPRIGDKQVQTSTYGSAIPYLWGVDRVAGNIIQSSDLIETPHTESVSAGGGKGGGGGPTTTTTNFSVSATFAVSLGRGPLIGIRRIFANRIVIWDPLQPTLDNPILFKFYPGDETQLPDPDLEALVGVGNQPAYRGQSYLVFPNLPLGRFGNQPPNFTFEVVSQGALTVPSVPFQGLVAPAFYTFDPVTRMIWIVDNGDDTVKVYRADDVTLQYTIDIDVDPQPGGGFQGITYQPAYVLVEQSLTGGQPTITTEPARMWIGDNATGILNGAATRVETLTFKTDSFYPVPTFSAYTPGLPIFDWRTVTLDGPNFKAARVHMASVGGNGFFPFRIVETTDPNQTVNTWLGTAGLLSDAFSHVNGLWATSHLHELRSVGTAGEILLNQRIGTNPGAPNDNNARLAYDADLNALFMLVASDAFGSSRLILSRADPAKGAVSWEVDLHVDGINRNPIDVDVHPELGDWWVLNIRDAGTDIFITRIDPEDGSVLEDLDLDFSGSLIGGERLFLYPGSPFAFVKTQTTSVRRFPLFTVPDNTTTVSLQVIVDEILDEVGIDFTLRDTSALALIQVKGYLVGSSMSARQALEPLMRAFHFDAAEIDYRLTFVVRGQSSSVTIPEDDLAARFLGSESLPPVQLTRGNESELPNQVDVVYRDKSNDYNIGTQSDNRLVTASLDISQIQVPVVLDADEARRLAQLLLQNRWRERDSISISVGTKYVALDPTDVITIPFPNGKSVPMRITRTSYSVPGLIEIEGFQEDPSIYTQVGPGAGTLAQRPSPVITVASIFHFMDIPLLRDIDDNGGFYAALGGPYPGWKAGELFRSNDLGITYSFLDIFTNAVTWGFTETVLGSTTQPYVWDDVNTVDIDLVDGTVASSSDAAVLEFANVILIGNEIIQFVNATDLGSGRFRLSRLLRGRRGTESEIGNHAASDRVIVLSPSTIKRIPDSFDNIGTGKTYKAVSVGTFLGQTGPSFNINTAKGLKPYAVDHLTVTGVPDVDTIVLGWIRRTRTNQAWRDFVNVGVNEITHEYFIDVFDTADLTTLVTTKTVAGIDDSTNDTSPAQTFSYSVAEQNTDFPGGVPASITFIVHQVSDTLGRGFPNTAVAA